MALSSDLANLLAGQLSRFVTLNRHQLAGQAANLEYWLGQVRNALDVIDDYPARFDRMSAVQEKYVREHGTEEFLLDANVKTIRTAAPPRRVSHGELETARKALCEATYRFLVRLNRDRLIKESPLRDIFTSLDIGVESRDLRHGN